MTAALFFNLVNFLFLIHIFSPFYCFSDSSDSTLNSNLTEHKTSDDHDSRYYTETEINNKLGGILLSGVYDLANPPSSYIFFAGPGSTNLPSGLGGNSCLVFQMFPANSMYNSLLVFNFASDKIAINRKNGSSTWTGWKYVALS